MIVNCEKCGLAYSHAVNGRCACGNASWRGFSKCGFPPTMGKAHLAEIELALEQAQDCLSGEQPEVGTHDEARQDTLLKIREALLNHVPSVRSRLP